MKKLFLFVLCLAFAGGPLFAEPRFPDGYLNDAQPGRVALWPVLGQGDYE